MMKRIVSLLLVLCLVLGASLALGSCEALDTPETMVTKAVAKTSLQDSYAATVVMDMSMSVMGESMDFDIVYDMKHEGVLTDAPKYSVDMVLNALGESVEMSMYSDSEWIYTVMDDGNYKQRVEEDTEDYSEEIGQIVKEIPSDLFEGVEIVKNEDGTRSVTVSIPDEVFAEIYEELVEAMTESVGMTSFALAIKDAVVTITVKDGLISVYDIDFTMEASVSGYGIQAAVEACVTFTEFGGVTVAFPDGYESFPELPTE